MHNLVYLNDKRVRHGEFATKTTDRFGMFLIPTRKKPFRLTVMSSNWDKGDWQHVSVSTPSRTPDWKEMCRIKQMFWGDDTTVVQYHPKKSEYVDNHPYCLHLWKKREEEFELPPSLLVGIKGLDISS